jgi:hypothetical protein
MKKVKIGQFHTNGKLLVTDPCYETDSDSIKKLTVKSGSTQRQCKCFSMGPSKGQSPECGIDNYSF